VADSYSRAAGKLLGALGLAGIIDQASTWVLQLHAGWRASTVSIQSLL
jgi:hypothetical protein